MRCGNKGSQGVQFLRGAMIKPFHLFQSNKAFLCFPSSLSMNLLQDISLLQIRALLDYMYRGEVSVQEEELPALLKVAEALKVKGLVEDKTGKPNGSSSSSVSKEASGAGSAAASRIPSIGGLGTPKKAEEEEAGSLVIDEENLEGGNVTMVSF